MSRNTSPKLHHLAWLVPAIAILAAAAFTIPVCADEEDGDAGNNAPIDVEIEIEIDADCNNDGSLAADPFPCEGVPDDPCDDQGFELRMPAKLVPENGDRVPARINWRPVKGDAVIKMSVIAGSGTISVYDQETGGTPLVETGDSYSFSAAYTPRPRTVWVEGVDTGSCKIKVEYIWDNSVQNYDEVKFTVFRVDLVAFPGVSSSAIEEDDEEDPGAYVGWNADESDNLVKLELRVEPALPYEYMSHYRLHVSSVYGRDGRIRLWSTPQMTGTPVIDGTGYFDLSLSGNVTDLTNLYVEGSTISSYAKDIKVTLERRNLPVSDSDKVYYSTLGIRPVKSRNNYGMNLDFVPLVRRSYELKDIGDVREKASDMAWTIYLFQVGAGRASGAILNSLNKYGVSIDTEEGDAGELDVDNLHLAHYAGWDNDLIFTDRYRGYVVENESWRSAPDAIGGESMGLLLFSSTDAVTLNDIHEFGNKVKILASDLRYGTSGIQRKYIGLNDDDDDGNGVRDNLDETITGTYPQKQSDIQDMRSLRIDELTPDVARSSGSFELSQTNSAAPDSGRIRLFDRSGPDYNHVWTSDSGSLDATQYWDRNYRFHAEGVQIGVVVLALEYAGHNIKWFDKSHITVVGMDLKGDLNRDGVFDEDDPEESAGQGLLISVNNDDDDGDSTVDRSETGSEPKEDNLVEIRLAGAPGIVNEGYIMLRPIDNGDKIRIWNDPHKGVGSLLVDLTDSDPDNDDMRWVVGTDINTMADLAQSVYVEGIELSDTPGDVSIELSFRDPNATVVHYDELRMTVYDVAVTNIAFDHTAGNGMTDGLIIRYDFKTPLASAGQKGEWLYNINTGDVLRNEPFLYVQGNTANINIDFATIPPVDDTLQISASSVSNIFPGTDTQQVSFVNGKAENVMFAIAGGKQTHCFDGDNDADVSRSWDRWQWQVAGSIFTNTINTTGPHTNYCVLNMPQEPWYRDVNTQPWVSALELACSDSPWAGGETDLAGAATRVTEAINGSGKFEYEIVGGAAKYLNGKKLNLSECIKRLNGDTTPSLFVNCTDCANFVTAFANLIGTDLHSSKMYSSDKFYTNPYTAIGQPAWTAPIGRPPRYPWGWHFSYHEVAWSGACNNSDEVFDACLKYNGEDPPYGASRTELLPVNVIFSDGVVGTPYSYRERLAKPGITGYDRCVARPFSKLRRKLE